MQYVLFNKLCYCERELQSLYSVFACSTLIPNYLIELFCLIKFFKFNVILEWIVNAIYCYWIQYYYNILLRWFFIPFKFKQFVMHYIISLFFLLLNINWIISAEIVMHNLYQDEIMLWLIWILLIYNIFWLMCWSVFRWKFISSNIIFAAFYSWYLLNIRMLQVIIITI